MDLVLSRLCYAEWNFFVLLSNVFFFFFSLFFFQGLLVNVSISTLSIVLSLACSPLPSKVFSRSTVKRIVHAILSTKKRGPYLLDTSIVLIGPVEAINHELLRCLELPLKKLRTLMGQNLANAQAHPRALGYYWVPKVRLDLQKLGTANTFSFLRFTLNWNPTQYGNGLLTQVLEFDPISLFMRSKLGWF